MITIPETNNRAGTIASRGIPDERSIAETIGFDTWVTAPTAVVTVAVVADELVGTAVSRTVVTTVVPIGPDTVM